MKIKQYLNPQALRTLVSTLLGVPNSQVLEWGKQQDVSSLKFFITVQINPSSKLADYIRFKNGVQTIQSQKETTAIVGFHGQNAFAMAEFFQSALISEQANQLFDKINCGLVRTSDIQNLTIPFGAGYEERAEIQLTLSHDFTIEYEQNKIETVEIGVVLNQ